jgi:hypothetical protein
MKAILGLSNMKSAEQILHEHRIALRFCVDNKYATTCPRCSHQRKKKARVACQCGSTARAFVSNATTAVGREGSFMSSALSQRAIGACEAGKISDETAARLAILAGRRRTTPARVGVPQ